MQVTEWKHKDYNGSKIFWKLLLFLFLPIPQFCYPRLSRTSICQRGDCASPEIWQGELLFVKLKIPIGARLLSSWASLVAQMVKRLPAMRETWVRFLGREDPLEKEMAIHSSTLAWKIPWTEEPDRLQSVGSPKSWTQLSDFTFTVTRLGQLMIMKSHWMV